MPQVIVKASPDAFHYALETNKGMRWQVREGCSTRKEVTLSCAQEFHRLYTKPGAPTRTRAGQNSRITEFHAKHCHIRLCKDGNVAVGGFIVLSGELIGLHNIFSGKGDWMMREAVSLGADRLDTYDVPQLIALYERHGFREVLREANTIKGQPDVVWMRRTA